MLCWLHGVGDNMVGVGGLGRAGVREKEGQEDKGID